MSDNGDTRISYNDLTWRSNGTAYFLQLSNRSHFTVDEGLGNIDIIGNGFVINGSGTVGLHLGSTNYSLGLHNINITGSFRYGMYGTNLDDLESVNVDVSNSIYEAIHVEGDDMLIRYSNIANIGSDSSLEIVGGISAIGSRITIDQAAVSGLHSAVETYAIGFNLYGGVDCVLSNSILSYGTGWGFPVWDRTTGSEIQNTTAINWSQMGSVYGIDIISSDFTMAWNGGAWTADSTSTITIFGYLTPDTNGWIWGTSGRDHLGGTAGSETLHGGANADILAGFGGADTFIFHPEAETIDVAIDFIPGTDKIDVNIFTFADRLEFGAATQAGACMVWDAGEYILWHDSNGNLPGGITGGMYLPYGTLISSSDLIF